MYRLTAEQLKKIMPRIPGEYAAAFIATQGELDAFGITANVNRYAMWLANVAHECGEFRTMVENGNYRTTTILKTWPSRFKSTAQAAPYAMNAKKLFNTVYANRMGNGTPASGDGFKYRGRGEPMVTGKDGYKNTGHVTGLPLLDNPDLACAMEYMNRVGGGFWHWKGLNRFADAGDFYAVVGRWNGGHIGMAQRKVYLSHALAVLKQAEHTAAVPLPTPKPDALLEEPSEAIVPPTIPPIDARGEPSEVTPRAPTPAFDAEAAQRRLRALGYWPGNPDGDEGTFMRDALLSFQADNHLPITGTLDDATWNELAVAGPKFIPESRANATAATLREKGSATITLTDRIKNFGKLLIGGGVAGSAVGDDSEGGGWLATIHGYYDQASYLIDPAKAIWGFMREHEVFIFIGIGLVVWFVAHQIQNQRVEDERTGANRGI